VREAAARASLTRLTRMELLVQDKVGRRTTHRLSQRAWGIVDEEARWLDMFGRVEPEWDGLWSVLAFSVPEARRALRHTARSRLRWLGFAPLYDGMWISPVDAGAEAKRDLVELGVVDVTSMRGQLNTSIPGGPQSAWDLDAAARQYADFADEMRGVQGEYDPASALALRSRLMLRWQKFRGVDVGLPAELLPAAWPRVATRRLFAERYDMLGPAAEERMRSHVGEISAPLAALITSIRLLTSHL